MPRGDDAPARPARKTQRTQPPRVYYCRDRLLHYLRQICPEELAHFPQASTFTVWKCVTDDPNVPRQEYRCLEIGHVWPPSAAQEAEGAALHKLFVVDKGAYHSELPDLVPYTEHGDGQRYIVEANGFVPTGIFKHFRRVLGNRILNPKLDDPVVIGLIQFIFILRDVRRYYAYTAPNDSDVHVHLAPLIEALSVATIPSRHAARSLQPPLTGLARPGVFYPQGTMNHGQGTTGTPRGMMGPPQGVTDPRMDPRLAAKSHGLPSTNGKTTLNGSTGIDRQEQSNDTTNKARTNAHRFNLIVPHGIMASEVLSNSTTTETATTGQSTPEDSTPGRTEHGSSTSPPTEDNDDNP